MDAGDADNFSFDWTGTKKEVVGMLTVLGTALRSIELIENHGKRRTPS